MNQINRKSKISSFFELLSSHCEYIMTFALGLLMIVQRFLSGVYKPVMDDWFLYGDLYKGISNRLANFAIPNEKFAIRPLAGVFDCFVNAPLFNHLWIVELFLTFSLLFGSFLIIKALRRNNFASGGFFLCLVCLFPVGLEATYWIAAATRVAYSLLFIGCATLSLDYCYKSDKVKFLVMFAVFGMLSVCFYEPAIVVYIILTLFIVWNNYKNKKDLLPLAIMAAHIAIIGIYYILNSGSGEIESRGGFLETDILEHTALVTDYTKNIFTDFTNSIFKNGYDKGMIIVFGGHKFIKILLIAILSIIFGVFSAVCIKKRKFSWKILVLGIVMFFGGLSLNYILGSDRIPLRLVFFAYLGIGIVIDELIVLLPLSFSRILCAVLLTVSAFSFTVTGIGEVSDYQKTSDIDVALTLQLINLDTKENITNTDKNVYVFSGQHYYDETKCVSWLDHIRGVSGNYADFTGCMRHITGAANTNNVMPFTYGDIHKLKPFIDIEGVCNFYNIEYDRTIVPVKLVADGDNYIIKRNDDSIVGKLTKVDDVSYQLFN